MIDTRNEIVNFSQFGFLAPFPSEQSESCFIHLHSLLLLLLLLLQAPRIVATPQRDVPH